jgi:hypothetical protein
LWQDVRKAQIVYSLGNDTRRFVPHSELDKLISIERVTFELGHVLQRTTDANINALAQTICKSASRLFATLVYIERLETVVTLLDEGVSDDDLPVHFEDSEHGCTFTSKSGKTIPSLTNWKLRASGEFYTHQWWMMAPIFRKGDHHEFNNAAVLPFTSSETIGDSASGMTLIVNIHPSHHDFGSEVSELVCRTLIA